MRIFYMIVIVLSASLHAADMNWIKNGDFSQAGGWGKDLKSEAGPHGLAAHLENKERAWKGLRQDITLPQPSPWELELSGWMKHAGIVKGEHDWELARMAVVFYDAAGARLGDW